MTRFPPFATLHLQFPLSPSSSRAQLARIIIIRSTTVIIYRSRSLLSTNDCIYDPALEQPDPAVAYIHASTSTTE
ncbi:uncharacterized protein N7515_006397 [Penicillium bovifimosum]|uniref:Uncharacterized protein n=1 Tax=Penicillium bovifimosum TaxID=126998 RepID=A0A9W9GUX9_9EURO|nr:uncharacterized protein N7515_006397 [Penicillium bovifimosum]KAJ5130358.1 hypothetical protein N7515_006397 [Penicillium bovifimosum]